MKMKKYERILDCEMELDCIEYEIVEQNDQGKYHSNYREKSHITLHDKKV